MAQQRPVSALYKFYDSKGTPDHDQRACDIQGVEVFFPWRRVIEDPSGGKFVHPSVENYRDDDEEAERDYLDEEPGDDNLLAHVGC